MYIVLTLEIGLKIISAYHIYRIDTNLYKNNVHCDKLSNQTLLNF